MLQSRWNTERGHIIVCVTPLYGVFRVQSVYRVRHNLYCLELEVGAMMHKQAWGISLRWGKNGTDVELQLYPSKRERKQLLKLPLKQIMYFIDQTTGLDIYDTLSRRGFWEFPVAPTDMDTEIDHANIGAGVDNHLKCLYCSLIHSPYKKRWARGLSNLGWITCYTLAEQLTHFLACYQIPAIPRPILMLAITTTCLTHS